MTHYDYRQRNNAAERKLKRILNSSGRRELEEQFALDHANDTDRQLRDYVRKQRESNSKFKRSDLIGYSYIVERFGGWENLMALVHRDIEEEQDNAD